MRAATPVDTSATVDSVAADATDSDTSADTRPSVRCPYCGALARLKDSASIYGGRSYGLVWDCRPCDAYVGVHKGTTHPLGRLANEELRKWKIRAHAELDPLWKSRLMTRREAYALVAEVLRIPTKKAHVGMFDVEQCKALVAALRQRAPHR